MFDTMHLAETELRERLKGLIMDCLNAEYVSTSGHLGYKTGNLYQSVRLDDDVQLGFRRADRRALFNNFRLVDKTVLDCGCNIGELSRIARQCGAKYVDGIEYDKYFVSIARLINSYNGCTRVSVKQGDLTDPSTFGEQYDVALAFSVFPYILPTLSHLARCVREVLVLETHKATGDIANVYVEPLKKFFPFYTFVGTTDFGKGEGDRAVIVFAKEKSYLEKNGYVFPTIELKHSRFNFADAFLAAASNVCPPGRRGSDDIRKVSQALSGVHNDNYRIAEGIDYWLDFIKGYLEFVDSGRVEDRNSYLVSFRELIERYDFDPKLRAKLSTFDELRERVRLRFEDVAKLAKHNDRGLAEIDPIIAFNPTDKGGRYSIKASFQAKPISINVMDGYHRTMWAMFFGYDLVPALFQYASVSSTPKK